VPERFQSSEESSPGQAGPSKPKKDKKDQKKSKKNEKKKGKKTKKRNDDDDEDKDAEDDHAPLGAGNEDDDDEGDFDDLEGYDELLEAQGGHKSPGSKKRPASAKQAAKKKPAKKHEAGLVPKYNHLNAYIHCCTGLGPVVLEIEFTALSGLAFQAHDRRTHYHGEGTCPVHYSAYNNHAQTLDAYGV
jgi:hypothetical protein